MSELVHIAPARAQARKPEWLKVRVPTGENYFELKQLMRGLGLHTVCESARCPNVGECWAHRTATFMILGDLCTRRCGFCAVPKGLPQGELDWEEPERVAQAASQMGLKYVVVTSVDRDDLKDGGATIFAGTIEALRQRLVDCQVEVLIPDFRGSDEALEIVLRARPERPEPQPRNCPAPLSGGTARIAVRALFAAPPPLARNCAFHPHQVRPHGGTG